MSTNEAINSAQALDRIVNDPHFIAVIEEIRQGYVNGIINSGADDVAFRENLKVRLDVLRDLTKRIGGKISSGTIEAKKIGWKSLFVR